MSNQPQVEAERAKFIGGSDIAAVVGLSPWKSPVALYDAKVGGREQAPANVTVKRRGHVWERVVADMVVERFAEEGRVVKVLSTNERVQDEEIPYFAAEIDMIIELDSVPTNVEIKTVHPFKAKEWGDELSDECPPHYAAQALWGLGITGRKTCIVAALIGADELRIYPIERDEPTIDWLRARARDFWELNVLPRIPPAPQSPEDLARLFPTSKETTIAGDEQIKLTVLRYLALSAEIDARTAERDVLELELKGFMREADSLTVPGNDKPVVTWKSRPWSHLDVDALKEAHPAVYREFLRKGSSRVFSVKSPKL